jgi:hypothetical protein
MSIVLTKNQLIPLRDSNNLPGMLIDISEDNNASSYIHGDEFAGLRAIMIVAPAALTGTITLATLDDPDSDETLDASWKTIQSPPGTDVSVAAGKSTVVIIAPFPAIRLQSDGTEAADRQFKVYGLRASVTTA